MRKLLLPALICFVFTAYSQNVGIGTSTPAYKLDVSGTLNATGGGRFSGTLGSQYGANYRILANADNAAGGGIAISDDGGFYDYNDAYVTFNGSTGLKISGASGAASTGTLHITNLGTGIVKSNAGTLTLAAASDAVTLANGSFILNQTTQQPTSNYNISGNGIIGGTLMVGANATAVDKLEVRDAMSVNEIKFRNIGGGDDSDPYRLRKVQTVSNTNVLELQLNDDPQEEFRILGNSCVGTPQCSEYAGVLAHGFIANGNAYHMASLGVGTSAPVSRLHVYTGTPTGLGTLPANSTVTIDNGNNNNYLTFRSQADVGYYSGLLFQDNNVGGYIAFRTFVPPGPNDGNNGDHMVYGAYTDHIFQNGASEVVGGKGETMRIKGTGNVGIGTSAPGTKLNVNGAIWAGTAIDGWGFKNGPLLGKYSDVGATGGSYPLSVPSGAEGLFVNNTSDAAFFGLITRGSSYNDYNAVVAWGDDAGDNLEFKFNNNPFMTIQSDGHIRWAGSSSLFLNEQGGSMEIGGNNSAAGGGTPYIDFHYSGLTQDYNVRMITAVSQTLDFHSASYNMARLTPDGIGTPIPAVSGDFDIWAVYSRWRGYWLDVQNDLDAIDNMRPRTVYSEALGKYVQEIDPASLPNVVTASGHGRTMENPDDEAINLSSAISLSWGGIRQLRSETKTRDAELESRIERLENLVSQLTGKELGEMEFSASATAYKGMENYVIMDARISERSVIKIQGLANYKIANQSEGSFEIKFTTPPAENVKFTYSSSF